MDTLPTELLAQIFKCGASEGCHLLIPYKAVNRCWRTAALEYPDLWTSVYPFCSINNNDAVSWTSFCLERSKSCLFDVVLHLPSPPNMALVSKIMLLIAQHIQRLRSLSVFAVDQTNAGEVFALLENAQRAPRLSNLELVCDDTRSISMTAPHDGILISTPALSSLRLHGVRSPVPFVGLRSLDLKGLRTSYADFEAMATASPLLVQLVLPNIRLLVDPQTSTFPPIQMPSLKALALSFAHPPPSNQFNPCHSLLSFLRLPNVEYLELVGSIIPDLAATFHASCFSNLRTLRLVGLTIVSRDPAIQNASYLRSLGTIEELHLIHSYAEYLLPLEQQADRSPKARLSRTRSINFRDEPKAHHRIIHPLNKMIPASRASLPLDNIEAVYPKLRCVCLDTLLAKDAVWLYTFVTERPNIRLVRLSQNINRHFSDSLGLSDGGALQTLPWRNLDRSDHQPVDAGKMLRERVQVEELKAEGLIPWRGPTP
ncbi:hypothetical protein MIND_01021200 [Mycena indigotica]|uniref:F-box domain-containing protein n=1 Tax=Mycena indigotica TaxID=2126181 RepID=A0A8H6S9J6_9AGAR|nr:uncharacterized protein MIND_01021200 [Mycena indigotica]KAF7294833.1 hypothetical protein MIND_01021200 [Mycena indigotica]